MATFVQETSPGAYTKVGVGPIIQYRNGEPPIYHSQQVLSLWSDEELATIKVYRATEFVVPVGMVATGLPSYSMVDGAVVESYDTAIQPGLVISDRQFFQALALQGFVTEDEALAAVQVGAIPAGMMPLINALPSDQQFNAKMLLSGATQFERDHPLVAAFAQANNITEAATDALWIFAASL